MQRLCIKEMLKERAVFVVTALFLICAAFPRVASASDESARIHLFAFSSDQDAILVECDGHFGMVDSGEDDDYPDGQDARYPFRAGTTTGQGHEDEVIAYLVDRGVTAENFEFYIGTHAHSDHVGSADEVIRAFRPARVYVPEYQDEYISDVTRRWDNLYVYDHMREAADEVGAFFITRLSYDADVQPGEDGVASPVFSLGSARIEIVNWSNHELFADAYTDANDYCWGVVVSCVGKKAFLAGDINNYRGDEDVLANQIGVVDVLKLAHHGCYGSNTVGFLQTLKPRFAAVTGAFSNMPADTVSTLLGLGTHIYCAPESAVEGKDAIVITLTSSGVSVDALANPGDTFFRANCGPYDAVAFADGAPVDYTGVWTGDDGQSYRFDGSPYGTLIDPTVVDSGRWMRDKTGWWWRNDDGTYPVSAWQTINGVRYYFNSKGYIATGWLKLDDVWYYLRPSGAMATGWQRLGGKWYWLDVETGIMATGWKQIDNAWYRFSSSGTMLTGWQKSGSTWYYLRPSGAMATGWQRLGGKWYWLDPETGAMRTGWIKPQGEYYWLGSSGAMAIGWRKLDGTWYWFNSSGTMQTGWKKIGKAWYWFDENGAMLASGWTPDGCYVNESGAWVKGKTRS